MRIYVDTFVDLKFVLFFSNHHEKSLNNFKSPGFNIKLKNRISLNWIITAVSQKRRNYVQIGIAYTSKYCDREFPEQIVNKI